jgi:hypothetical protein
VVVDVEYSNQKGPFGSTIHLQSFYDLEKPSLISGLNESVTPIDQELLNTIVASGFDSPSPVQVIFILCILTLLCDVSL